MNESLLVSSLPDVGGLAVLDALHKVADFPVAVVALDGGLAVNDATVVVELDSVAVCGEDDGLALQLVVLEIEDSNI